MLRYWQLIESLFEPALPSVKAFRKREDGTVVSNLEAPGWRQSLESGAPPVFITVMRYLSSLDRDHCFEQIVEDCNHAWRALRSTIVFPRLSDTQCLTIRTPTPDLGRDAAVRDEARPAGGTLGRRIDGIRSAYWREGYIAERFPVSRWPLLIGMDLGHSLRFAIAAMRRHDLRWAGWNAVRRRAKPGEHASGNRLAVGRR